MAYVVFTSGSTGAPKGVAVTHLALANYVAAFGARLGENGLNFALASTLAADLGYSVLYPCFASGGRLHVLTEKEATEAKAFSAAITRYDIDVLKIAPSHFSALSLDDAEGASVPRKALIFGGEALSASLVREVARKAKAASPRAEGLRIFNHYGPTETTVGALMTPIEPQQLDAADLDVAPIGRPLENLRVYAVSPDFTLAPQGAPGEICIGGAGVAQGYLNRADLTAERFVPDPYGPSGGRLYRTGDLGVFRDGGAFRFLGRIDAQVKIRGFRVEPGEVEARLCDHAGVRQAAVSPYAAPSSRTLLAAYVVAEDGVAVSAQDLSAFLRQTLADYMVPSAYVFVDGLPVTKNGKIDRKRLPPPDVHQQMQPAFRAPQGETETQLATIFAGVLGVERIGADDNFFALGGDSISSIQAASRATACGFQITPKLIFRHQSVAELAAAIGDAPALDFKEPIRVLETLARSTVASDDIEDSYPATPLQEGLLFHTLSRPNSGVYVMQHRYWIEGDVDVELFRAAWQAIADAHAILKTSFSWENTTRCRQLVRRNIAIPFEYLDFHEKSAQAQEQELDEILSKERREGFDLAKAPLLRIRLVRLAERRYLLIRSHHHILFDAWCTSLILNELQSNYVALAAGGELSRGGASDFGQYIDWLSNQNAQSAESFWRQRLEGFREPTVLRGSGRAADDADTESIEDLVAHLSKEDTEGLKALSRRWKVTGNSFAQAALALLLANHTSQTDVVFGVTVAGRPTELPGVEAIVGLFINGLPLRMSIDMSEPLRAFLQRTLAQNYAMRDFEYSSLTEVQSWSEIPRGQDLFQVLLTFENAPVDPRLYEGNEYWRFTDCWHRTHTNYPLTFVVIPGERLHIQLTYARGQFERPAAERLLSEYRRLLEEMIRNPDRRVGEMELVGPAERRLQLEQWNQTSFDYAEPRDLIGRFEAQVLACPHAVAAVCGEKRITYEALNDKANRLARALIYEGIESDAIVALFEQRGLDFLAAMLGVFKAGAGYLPIDPAHPDGRITQVLSESRVGAVIVGETYVERAREIIDSLDAAPPLSIELHRAFARPASPESTAPRHGPKNAAFVIFTSGSTGKPKGAIVEHEGMFNNLITKVPVLGLTDADVIAQTASQCFDISVWQFLTALTLGARVEIFQDEISQDPRRLLKEIADRGVTILETVPSMIKALLDAPEAGVGLKSLRWLIPCGEAFTPELCRRFMAAHPQVKLLNAYGPAECSDDVSYYPIEEAPTGNDLSVPIGRPVDNTQIYILNRWLETAPIGAKGEICVAGLQVGRGYLNRPDLTAAAFVPDPYGSPGSRLYRTGDLGAFRQDGVIEFHGRTDHQVKIRGFRVEPGEVEACLVSHPQIEQACVIAHETAKGVYRLLAYVVGKEGDAASLRAHLLQHVPDHMVPSAFLFIES
ncbi:MAG TPA: amino acid adenylation domain-containing protein, partial [Methylocystis sp.]|nr:amino acid adenylation domain-containing protein [Methylocystis sp.]